MRERSTVTLEGGRSLVAFVALGVVLALSGPTLAQAGGGRVAGPGGPEAGRGSVGPSVDEGAVELVGTEVLERAAASAGAVAVRLSEWKGERLADPFFAEGRLRLVTPRAFRGLAGVEKPGLPVFDPGSNAWFASANGQLVRLEVDGRLVVVADDVQGLDVDVRAAQGLAVSREGGERIVLHRFGAWGRSRTTVLTGDGYFYPRFSPDGSRILVAESRAGGGHMWITDLDGGTWDVGQGYGATWLPDSSGIVFARVSNDQMRITAAELWKLDLATGREVRLTDTAGLAETEPAVTPDGRHIVFVEAFTGDVMLVSMPEAGREVAP